MSRLGAPKEIEKLARRWRRAGGTVEVTGGSHLRWVLGDCKVFSARSPNFNGQRQDLFRLRKTLDNHTRKGVTSG